MSIHISRNRKPIMAAEEDEFDFKDDMSGGEEEFIAEDPDDTFGDQLDDMADTIDDMQDDIEEFQEDDPSIEADNNIADHYIVECDRCHGIFISALVESDQEVEKISGVCPLCEKNTDQYIKWVVKPVGEQ